MQEKIRERILEIQYSFGLTSRMVANCMGITYGTYHVKRTGHGNFLKRDLESLVVSLEEKRERFNFNIEKVFESKEIKKEFYKKRIAETQNHFGLTGIAMAEYMNISGTAYSNKKADNVDFFNEENYKKLITNLHKKFKNFNFESYKVAVN
ncbi:MAG: hypothetical protein LBP34_07530 [Flavobacteriaceae bacterium]|jgi:hypothetical protein|nr:hypothetical protein [Flavobacteriaceae bacterium]